MNGKPEPKDTRSEDIKSQREPLEEASKPQRPARPNYASIYSRPLPVVTYPLPVFLPHNPLSLLHIAYTILTHYLSPPTSHPEICYGYFSARTRSVHVTDPKHARALWEMGFFGKGSLSRSEPNWLDQEKKRAGLIEGETAEEITRKRRLEREKFKRERARAERQALEDQLRKESASPGQDSRSHTPENGNLHTKGTSPISVLKVARKQESDQPDGKTTSESQVVDFANRNPPLSSLEIVNQEHHQLNLEEAFFLIYGLAALKLNAPENAIDNYSLLQIFRQHSYFPPVSQSDLSPDDPFLLNYVVYHHFRSLGWVVRDGIKFAVDYLLYERGPVFKHAAFALIIVPSYTHAYWQDPQRPPTRTQRRKGAKDWTWLHCVNRVQSHVVKTLVLVYVDVPPPSKGAQERDVGSLLESYRIREFCIQRWSANRNRS